MPAVVSRRTQLLLFTAFLALVGCRRAEEIRTYTVPKITAPSAPAAATADAGPAETGEPVDRMLTAIVPENGRAWFYKVVGPIPAVDSREKEILDFVVSIPPAGGAATPAWQLPENWTARPGTDGVTLATIQIPHEEKPIDLTVTALPWSDTPDDLLRNVNRWRGQMGLPPASAVAEFSDDVRELKAGERTITIVDLRGRFRRGMMPPFAGGGPMAGGAAPAQSGPFTMPTEHPPLDDRKSPPSDNTRGRTSSIPVGEPAAPKFDAPASWQAAPASGMNRAVFRVVGEGGEAAMTVSTVPTSAGAMFADPLSNINLWRSGVGLPPVTADELPNISEPIEIDGRQATYVAAVPEEGKPEATLAAMVAHGDQIWYFKIKGPRQLVTDRQDEFKAFLKTVKFAE